AFDSPLMEAMWEQFARVAAGVGARAPQIAVVSNVTGQLVGPDSDFATPGYWVEHIRRPVRFADSVRHLHAHGATRFLEVGPGAGLSAAIEASLPAGEVVVVGVLGKGRPEVASVIGALGQAFVAGVGVD